MKIDTLPDPLPSEPGTMWINSSTGRLMISDGEGFIPLTTVRKGDEGRLAALIAELAVPALSRVEGPPLQPPAAALPRRPSG